LNLQAEKSGSRNRTEQVGPTSARLTPDQTELATLLDGRQQASRPPAAASRTGHLHRVAARWEAVGGHRCIACSLGRRAAAGIKKRTRIWAAARQALRV